MPYISGFNNYTTIDQARREFYRCTTWVALKEMSDGSATISWLQNEPMYQRQTPYNLANATKIGGG